MRSAARAAQWRFLPFAFAVAFVAATLIVAGTSIVDLARYAAYAVLAVALPGTLVYRALRRTPHTLVEDVAIGTAVGLVLELGAWAAFSALGLRGWLWAWPLAVVIPFAAVPGLRKHWRVRGYAPTPLGWSWSMAGVVAFFTAYLRVVFLARNPILPVSEDTRQYLDLAYQLSLAADAKHHIPLDVPQVAGEPLYYHWFGYAHMAATSLVGHIDLPVVALRLAIPALCAAAIVLVAVAGWRISGRPYVGAGAAALFFVVGEVNYTHPVTQPFGTQATFVIWHGMSMTYSWVLLLALIPVVADRIGRAARVPEIGPGAWVLTVSLMLGSSGAKASSVPVVALGLAFTAMVLLVTQRRLPWAVILAGLIAAVAQAFATAVLFSFQTYGLDIGPFSGLARYWAAPPGRSGWVQPLVVLAVTAAFVVNMELRLAGIVPLLWLRKGKLEPAQWFLLGGALAGPGLYLATSQPGGGNQYFTRAGFAFGMLLSAWGYAMVLDRARLNRRGRVLLGAATLAFAAVLCAIQIRYAGPQPSGTPYSPVLPIMLWSLALGLFGLVVAVAWQPLTLRSPGLAGRGGVVALTGVLVAGAPGLVMDEHKSAQAPNGGAYATVPLPRSRIEAARWVRDHSRADDIVATNVHCLGYYEGWCDSRSFWLSAYAERRVLVEGWGFAPRIATTGTFTPFWDPDRLARNDAAFTAPTADGLAELRDRDHVRWLVVDRSVGPESAALPTLATPRYDNGRLAVYEVR